MVELRLGLHTVDVPYTLRLYGVTEEQFDEMVDEDTRAELIDGVMIVHSPASPRHDDIAGFLRSLMRIYATSRRLGRVLGPDALVRLRPGQRFGPDLFFLTEERVPRPLPREQFNLVPDLMLEVLSPSTRDFDLDEKRPAYRRAGVSEIWIVDPEGQEIILDRRHGKRYATKSYTEGRVESAVLIGFWIDAGWLWSDPLPNDMECLQTILG
jgi:Uma2 family endonuclease